MQCNHTADANSLTAWCRSLIQDGKFEFFCPVKEDGSRECGAKWDYHEIRRFALLTDSEMEYFEKKLSENAAHNYAEIKQCLNCNSFVERQDLNNLRVVCLICKMKTKNNYEFCWQCEREWTGVSRTTASDTCGREGCVNKDLDILAQCKMIKLSDVTELEQVPSIRACPTCGNKSLLFLKSKIPFNF
jgi:hypothetical protein